jgi:hypothetical protein
MEGTSAPSVGSGGPALRTSSISSLGLKTGVASAFTLFITLATAAQAFAQGCSAG